jgi:hypothetical protein
MRLFAHLVVGLFFSGMAIAASVVEWRGPQQQASQLYDQIIGRWEVAALYEDNNNVSEQAFGDYWIFRTNGFVEHLEQGKGIRRSTFGVDDRTLIIRDRRSRTDRQFLIKYIDEKRVIWEHRVGETVFTYNLERH